MKILTQHGFFPDGVKFLVDHYMQYMLGVQVKFKLYVTRLKFSIKLEFTDSQVIKVPFLHLQMCRYITN